MSEGMTCDRCGALDREPQIKMGVWVCPACDLVYEIVGGIQPDPDDE